jgi:hypothetical protein
MCAFLALATIFDLWTAFSSPLFHLLETNPLYLTYGVWPLTILNFIWIAILIIGMKKAFKLFTLFSVIMATLFIGYGHILGGMANLDATKLYYTDNEKVMEYAEKATTQQKMDSYYEFVFERIMYPYLLCIIGFTIIFFLYKLRKPKRDKYVDEICRLAAKIRE